MGEKVGRSEISWHHNKAQVSNLKFQNKFGGVRVTNAVTNAVFKNKFGGVRVCSLFSNLVATVKVSMTFFCRCHYDLNVLLYSVAFKIVLPLMLLCLLLALLEALLCLCLYLQILIYINIWELEMGTLLLNLRIWKSRALF